MKFELDKNKHKQRRNKMHSRDIRVHSNQEFEFCDETINIHDITSIIIDDDGIRRISLKDDEGEESTITRKDEEMEIVQMKDNQYWDKFVQNSPGELNIGTDYQVPEDLCVAIAFINHMIDQANSYRKVIHRMENTPTFEIKSKRKPNNPEMDIERHNAGLGLRMKSGKSNVLSDLKTYPTLEESKDIIFRLERLFMYTPAKTDILENIKGSINDEIDNNASSKNFERCIELRELDKHLTERIKYLEDKASEYLDSKDEMEYDDECEEECEDCGYEECRCEDEPIGPGRSK